jgi:uncharacterized protein YjiS (DUF1127 family)
MSENPAFWPKNQRDMRQPYSWVRILRLLEIGRKTYLLCNAQAALYTFIQGVGFMLNLVLSGLQHLRAAYQSWRQTQAAYDELSSLDDRSLADIGITRADIPYLFARDIHDAAKAQAAGLAQNDNRRAA